MKTSAVVAGGEFALVDFPAKTSVTANGYELSALLPLSLLGVGSASAFCLEVSVTAARGPGAQAERSAWIHAKEAYRNGKGMARITIA